MPAILKLPVEKKIFLNLTTEDDPEQDTYVVVRQGTQKDVERRADQTADASRIYRGTDEVEIRTRWSLEEQKRLEAYLTLVDCNIVLVDDTDDTKTHALFKFQKINGRMSIAMTEEAFKAAWGQLNETWADAIHNAVLQMNPQWNPNWKG